MGRGRGARWRRRVHGGRAQGGGWAELGRSVGGGYVQYTHVACLLYAHVPAVRRPLLHRASVCCVCGGRGRAQRHGWPGWRPGRRRTRECVAGVRTVCVSPKSIGIPERFFCPFFRAPPVSNRRAPFQTAPRPFQTDARRFKPRAVRFRPARRFKPRAARFRPARRFRPRTARFKTPAVQPSFRRLIPRTQPTRIYAVS